MLGAEHFEIPFKVIDKLKDWNTHTDKANEEYDRKLISALLLMCCSSNDLANYQVNNDVREFISGKEIKLKHYLHLSKCFFVFRFYESSRWCKCDTFQCYQQIY